MRHGAGGVRADGRPPVVLVGHPSAEPRGGEFPQTSPAAAQPCTSSSCQHHVCGCPVCPSRWRLQEMFSLVRFLRIQPHTNYFCKNCPCSSMDYRINAGGRECELCGHSPLRHYNWCVPAACTARSHAVPCQPRNMIATPDDHDCLCRLNRYVMNPIKQFGMSGPGRDAMLLLRREVLDGVLLRRTKTGEGVQKPAAGLLRCAATCATACWTL